MRAQPPGCTSPGFFVYPTGTNANPFTLFGSSFVAWIDISPYPQVTCTFTLAASQAQHYVIVQYQEYWYQFPECSDCSGTDTYTLSGPDGRVLHTEVLGADGADPPPASSGWTLIADYLDYGYNEWTRTVYYWVDVSSETQNAAPTLQFTINHDTTSGSMFTDYPVYANYDIFRFTMNQTPASFRPLDSGDPAANCGVGANQGNCWPQYTAQFSDPNFQAPIQFTLSLPTGGMNLAGSSTNAGPYPLPDLDPHPDTPDYVFESAKNATGTFTLASPTAVNAEFFSQQIQTNAPANQAVATVSSWDFGGVANLVASPVLQGVVAVTPQAEIVTYTGGAGGAYAADGNGTYLVSQFLTPPSCAGSGLFASLPVDVDCNGIADFWEGQYTDPTGGHLNPTDDNEPGYNGTTIGDGYSVHDEYRGFHYIQDTVDMASGPNGTVSWSSTDPVKMQDVFFWDSAVQPAGSSDPCTSPDYSQLEPNCMTTALRALLAQETIDTGGQPFMAFWRANPAEANAASLPAAADPSQGVGVFNQNSVTRAAATVGSLLALGGYALVYGSIPAVLTGASDCAGATPPSVLGYYADSGGFANNGASFVNIDLPQIAACSYLAGGYPQGTFLGWAVAHEAGHRLGLFHTHRPVTYFGPLVYDYVGLTMQNYMDGYTLSPPIPATMFVRYAVSYLTGGLFQPLDSLAQAGGSPPFFYCPKFNPLTPGQPSGEPWVLTNCNFAQIPYKLGPIPAAPSCLARYATTAAPTPTQAIPPLNFLVLETAGTVTGLARGHLRSGLDLMGFEVLFNVAQFGTEYSFDPVCELPYLNVTPAPQQ